MYSASSSGSTSSKGLCEGAAMADTRSEGRPRAMAAAVETSCTRRSSAVSVPGGRTWERMSCISAHVTWGCDGEWGTVLQVLSCTDAHLPPCCSEGKCQEKKLLHFFAREGEREDGANLWVPYTVTGR